MTERGLPDVGATACPFVALEDDRDERSTRPDHRHRCFAEASPAPRALAHQETYCLAPAFATCPTFVDWARREAARPRRSERFERVVEAEPTPERRPRREWKAPPPWLASTGGAPAAGPADEGPPESLTDSLARRDRDAGGRTVPGAEAARAWEMAEATPTIEPSSARRPSEPRVSGGGVPSGADEAIDDLDLERDARRSRIPARSEELPGFLSLDRGAGATTEAGEGSRRPVPPTSGERSIASPGRAAARADRGGPPERRYRHDEDVDEGDKDRDRASAFVAGGARGAAGRSVRGVEGPAWERPQRYEAYPSLRTRVGLPDVPRVALAFGALIVAALVLFFIPPLLIHPAGTGAVLTPGPSDLASVDPSASLLPTPMPSPTAQTYAIQAGDVLSKVAAKFGISLKDLLAANPSIKNPDKVSIGQVITIPVPASSVIVDGGSAAPASASATP